MDLTTKLLTALILIGALLGTSACQENRGQETRAATQEAPTMIETAPSVEGQLKRQGRRLDAPLPANIVLHFPYHMRRDVIEPTNNGGKRRKVGIEYLTIDRNEALSKLEEQFRQNGFRRIDTVTLRDGGDRVKYHRERFGTVILNAPRAPLKQYRNPSAKGHLSLDFPHQGT